MRRGADGRAADDDAPDHSYRRGDDPSAPNIMQSAGGNAEYLARRPAAGRNRTLLRLGMVEIERQCPGLIGTTDPDLVTLINASPKAESVELTGRTETPDGELLTPQNIERVRRLVGDRPTLAFGDKAKKVCAAAGIEPIAHGEHLSLSNLNRTPTPGFKGKAATAKRIAEWAAKVCITRRD